MSLPGRIYNNSSNTYRYGFNGQEKDIDISNEDLDFGARIYDARICRFLTLDPLIKDYPSQSPYGFAANNPILLIDGKGKCPLIPFLIKGATGAVISATMQFAINYIITGKASEAFNNINWWQVAADGGQSMIPWNPPGGKWGKAAMSAAVAVSANALNGNYAGLEGAEALKAVSKDFIISYLASVGTHAAMEKLGKYVPKIAQWLANEGGLDPKSVKKITGRWALKSNQTSPKGSEMTAKVANFLDDNLGCGTVKDVDKEVVKSLNSKGGDIDVVTEKFNIEVKSGSASAAEIMKYADIAKKEGKEFVLFAPDLQGTVEKKLKEEGIKVIRKYQDLLNTIKGGK